MRKYLLSTACVGFLVMALPAVAQTVNYGKLEDIFGEPVTTSATGKPQKASEVPANMEIVTQDDIRRSGADNIPDVLQYLVGIDFRRSAFDEPELSIRGFDEPWNPRLLVLINGQPIYEDFFGDVIWAAIPVQLDEIRQIEVVKGPTAALFGFNAASGVINIITYDPLYDPVNAATLRLGSQDLKEGSVVATAMAPDSYGLRLSAGGFQANEYDKQAAPEFALLPSFKPQDGTANFDGRLRLTEDTIVSLNGYTGTMKRNFPADLQWESDRTWSLRGRLTSNTAVGLADFDLYWTRWKFDFPILPQSAVSTTRDLRFSDLFKIGTDHTIRLSGEYKYNEANGQFSNGSTDFYNTYSAGVMWDWQVLSRLSLNNAVRYDYLELGIKGGVVPETTFTAADYNNRTVEATSFNSGLVFQATDLDVIRALVSRGYQLPSLDVLGMQIPGAFLLSGDPGTRATQVTNYELDYDRTVSALDAVFRAAVFRQTNDDLFNFLIAANAQGLISTNTGASNETGVELSAKSRPGTAFRWNLGYKYSSISDHYKSASGTTVLAEPFSIYNDATSMHSITGGIGYTLGAWEFDVRGGWHSHYQDWRFSIANNYSYFPVTTKPYATVDTHIGYDLNKYLYLGLTVDQLTQARTLERGAGIPLERRVFGTLTAHF